MPDDRIPFSRRVAARRVAQLGPEDMPDSLRLSLWNIIAPWLWSDSVDMYRRRAIWVYNFEAIKWAVDEIPGYHYRQKATEKLKDWLQFAEWHEVYDFVEALPDVVLYGYEVEDSEELRPHGSALYDDAIRTLSNYAKNLNAMLIREGAPYRYTNGYLVPITNEYELAELQRATNSTPFQGARKHLETAVSSLAQRPEPDYRNSIKESISAVESLLQEATGIKGEKLPALLSAFEKKFSADLHGAFRSSIASLYGWTSDANGIRHGIFGDEEVSRTEAQFMLIACSALVNFLVSKTE